MTAGPETVRLTWVGHATVVLDLGGVRLLTDPLLRPHAGPLRRIGPPPHPAAWQRPDAVLLSHLHHDHAEVASLRRLHGVPLLTGARNAAWAHKRVGAVAHVLGEGEWAPIAPRHPDPGGTPDRPEVAVRLVRADHTARPMPHRPNDAHGFLVRSQGRAVWFAGDTSLYAEMAGLPDLAGGPVDVALVPIAGWGPRLSPGHLGPAEAAEACALVAPRAVLPIHHGTLHPRGIQHVGSLAWMHRPLERFRDELARTAPGVRLLDVPLGGSVEV